jgi:Uma2 family endonuclease
MTMLADPPSIATQAPSVAIEPDDLLRMESSGLFELSEGRLLEKHMGYDANWTAGQIAARLNVYMWQSRAGDVLPEQSFRCFPDDTRAVRRPDVAFIAADRIPSPRPTGHVPIRPDLAIEVVSPTDEVDELELKLADYRAAGIPLIWVVIPAVRLVRIFRPDAPIAELRVGETLTGDPVLPGFSVAVADLFPAVEAAAPKATA